MPENKLKPVFMLIWRHLFTFMSFGYLIYVLVSARGNPHRDIYGFFVWVFAWAIIFDSVKMKAKMGTSKYRPFERHLSPQQDYSYDPFNPTKSEYYERRSRSTNL